jgi:hypothetical protein
MHWLKSSKAFPLRIFLVALFLRLVPVVVMRDIGIGLDDMYQYDMLARSLAAGNGYRWYADVDLPIVLPYLHLDLSSLIYDPRGVLTSFRPPLYPAFLGLVYFVFGAGARRFFIARLLQAALAASLAPLTFALASRLFPGRDRPGRIAAWIVTLYPMLVLYPLSLATENLFFVLMLSSVLTLLKAKESLDSPAELFGKGRSLLVRFRWFILAGLLLGLTCLTRSVAQIFAVSAAAWVLFFLKRRLQVLVMLLMIGLVVGPWILRNSILYGKFTWIESAIGYDLFLGYHPQGTGTFQYPQSLDLMTIVDDSERDEEGIQKALGFIKADPKRFLDLTLHRAGYFFGLERRALTYFYSNDYFGYIPPPALAVIFAVLCLPFVIVSVSGAVGLALLEWKNEICLLILIMIGYITPHLLIIAEDRFHLAVVPFLAILAAQGWTGGRDSIRSRWVASRAGKVALLLASFAVMLLLVNWGWELWHDADKLVHLFGPSGNYTYFSY